MADENYEPLYANGWYEPPEIQELRQEIQKLYEIINELEDRIVALEP